MKLQTQVSRRYKNKEYRKFWTIIPAELVEKLGWVEGQELVPEVKGRKLILTPAFKQ